MATSGTNVFTITRDEIISAALRLLEVLGVGEEPIAEDYKNCSEALNIMIKSWAKKGFPLWVYETVTIPLLADVNEYPIGSTAGYIHSVNLTNGGTGYPDTGTFTFDSGTAAGEYTASGGVIQSLILTDVGGGYIIPPNIIFDGGGTDADAEVTLTGVATPKPLRVVTALLRNTTYDTDTALTILSENEYSNMGSKFSKGVPNQLYVYNGRDQMLVKIMNTPVQDGDKILLTVQRMFQDMSSPLDEADFPQEWTQALKWGLASELAEEYGAQENKIVRISMKAEQYVVDCFDWSQEEPGVYFTVETR